MFILLPFLFIVSNLMILWIFHFASKKKQWKFYFLGFCGWRGIFLVHYQKQKKCLISNNIDLMTTASCLQVILKVCNLCYLVLMLRFLLCNACTREVNINYKLYLSHTSYIGHQTQSKRNLTYTLYYYSNKSIWILLLHRWRAPHKK